MPADWPLVPLREVLTHRKEFIRINDLVSYKRCRVQLHAQGVVLRDTVPGAEIKTKKQQVCRPGEFLVAEIDAKLGGYGIVPGELDSAVVSSHYFLFQIDPNKLERDFLGYYIRTRAFHEQVAAQGSTNYAAIRPGHVLEYTMPLPPVAEQRQIVARVDAIATRVAEARRLREEATAEHAKLWIAAIELRFAELSEWHVPIGQVLKRVKRAVTLVPGRDYFPAGLTNQAKGVICYAPISSSGTKYPVLYSLHKDDLVFSKLKVWEGSLAIVSLADHDRVVSSEFPTFTVDYDAISRDYLDLWLRRPSLWKWFGDQVRGIGGRKIRVDEETFLSAPLPLPARGMQGEVATRFQHLRQLMIASSTEQAMSSADLDALLPSVLNRAFAGKL